EVMDPVNIRWVLSPEAWVNSFFRCNRCGCMRHFNSTHGYVDIRDAQIDGSTKKIRSCPNNYVHSMGIVGLSDGEPRWECILKDCAPEPRSSLVGQPLALC